MAKLAFPIRNSFDSRASLKTMFPPVGSWLSAGVIGASQDQFAI